MTVLLLGRAFAASASAADDPLVPPASAVLTVAHSGPPRPWRSTALAELLARDLTELEGLSASVGRTGGCAFCGDVVRDLAGIIEPGHAAAALHEAQLTLGQQADDALGGVEASRTRGAVHVDRRLLDPGEF